MRAPAAAPARWTPAEIEEIRRLVLEHEGVEYARERGPRPTPRRPKPTSKAFAPSEERETLALIADFVVDRDR